MLRSFAAPAATSAAAATPSTQGDNVVVPHLVDTLEWVLDSPPPIHQFDEPPVSQLFDIFRINI